MIALSVDLALVIGGGSAWAEVFAYPKKGQSQQQFEQDQFQCHQWTKGQTGVDPTKPQQSAAPPPPQQGGAVKGAARGAALGAGVGAAGGSMKQAGANKQAAQAQQQAQAQAQADRSKYDKAYAVCLEGRGYQVR